MRRPVPRLLLLVATLAAGVWGPHATVTAGVAQGATPEAGFPITPDPAACTVEPRSPDSLIALLGTPVADDVSAAAAQAPEPFVAEVPVGQPAGKEVRADIIAAVIESTACFNAGDSRRAFALFTDVFVQGYVAENALTAESIGVLIADPEPVPAEVQETVLAVTDVTMLADGRVGAFVVTTSEWRGPDAVYMLFVRQGERWLIDDVIDFLAA